LSLNNWKERPVTGWGFSIAGDDFATNGQYDGCGYHGLLASVGVVGIAGFAGQILYLLIYLVKNNKKRFSIYPENDARNTRWLYATGAGFCACFWVQGIGEAWMMGVGSFMTFSYFIGISAILSAIQIRNNEMNPWYYYP